MHVDKGAKHVVCHDLVVIPIGSPFASIGLDVGYVGRDCRILDRTEFGLSDGDGAWMG
jgi:hypothetical protein